MKSSLMYILLACCLILACSDSSTDPAEQDPQTEFNLAITCSTDSESSISQSITASAGGAITTTDARGVTYTLTIPPHSLAQTTTITLIPLDSFSVEGDALVRGFDTLSTAPPPGLLCFPDGLVFDSGATLSMHMPPAFVAPADSTITMIFFDTAAPCFYPIETAYDTASKSFSATIRHFSGYTTVDVPPAANDCDLLAATYQPFYDAALSAVGTALFFEFVVRLYEIKASNVRREPVFGTSWIACPSFDSRVDADVALLVDHHWDQIQEIYAELEVDNPHISDLIRLHTQLLNLLAYVQMPAPQAVNEAATALKLFISNRLRAIATHGYLLCQADNCDGTDYLSFARNYGAEGWIITADMTVDNAYLTQLSQWIDDCCSEYLNVTVSVPGPTVIKRYAIDPDVVEADQYSYICSLAVHVERPGGTPAAGVPVRLFRNDETSHFGSFTTNEDGVASFLFNPSGITWVCQTEEVWQIRAEAYETNGSEWFGSDNSVTVTFVNTLITTSINYMYTYHWDGGGEPELHWTASLSGSGTGPARTTGWCASTCEGLMQRDYSGSQVIWNYEDTQYVTQSWSTVGPDSVYACRANLEVHSVSIPSLGRAFNFIFGASISLGSGIFAGLVYQWDYGRLDTLAYGLANTVWPETALLLYAGEGGSLGDTTWTWNGEGVGDGSVVTATLQVSVQATD